MRFPISGSSSRAAASVISAPESGWWWNSAESGTGYFVERQGATIFMAFYLYGSDGRAVWYVASGTPVSTGSVLSMTGSLIEVGGGQTLTSNPQATTSTTIRGTITLQFASSTAGVLPLPSGRQVTLSRFTAF